MFAAKKFQNVVKDPAWTGWKNGYGDAPGAGPTTSATQLLTVYGCVTRIADVMGTMAVDHFTRTACVQSEVATRAPWLDQPNPETDWATFMVQCMWSSLLDGNTFVTPIRNPMGRVIELYTLDPTTVHLDRKPGQRTTALVNGRPFLGELLHLPAYLLPGQVRGINPIENARIAVGLGLAAQDYGKGFFDNSGVPSVVIKSQEGFTPDQRDEVRESWATRHQGARKAGGVGLLSGGADIQMLTVQPDHAQFLETRRFSAAEIAANLFHVPPDMVGVGIEGSSLTYQNMETRWTEFIRSACQPWMTRYERAFSYHLLPRPQFIKFNPNVYLRADTKTRYETHKIGIDAGFVLDDEARALEDLPPLTPEQRAQVLAMRKPASAAPPAP